MSKKWSQILKTRLEHPRHPHNPKLCAKRTISTQKLSMKKIFFCETIFRNIFWDFSTHQNPKNRVWADPGMCPYLLLVLIHGGQRNWTTRGSRPAPQITRPAVSVSAVQSKFWQGNQCFSLIFDDFSLKKRVFRRFFGSVGLRTSLYHYSIFIFRNFGSFPPLFHFYIFSNILTMSQSYQQNQNYLERHNQHGICEHSIMSGTFWHTFP